MTATLVRKTLVAADTIFDVGMNHGDDTQYYLNKGFRVVAFEANPLLVRQNSARFQKEIAAGRLTIIQIGIAPEAGVFDFYVNDEDGRFLEEEKTPLKPGDTVAIVPAIAGG